MKKTVLILLTLCLLVFMTGCDSGGGIIDWDCPLDCLIDMGAPQKHDYRTKDKRR